MAVRGHMRYGRLLMSVRGLKNVDFTIFNYN